LLAAGRELSGEIEGESGDGEEKGEPGRRVEDPREGEEPLGTHGMDVEGMGSRIGVNFLQAPAQRERFHGCVDENGKIGPVHLLDKLGEKLMFQAQQNILALGPQPVGYPQCQGRTGAVILPVFVAEARKPDFHIEAKSLKFEE
jgi:hypothetical protein